VIVLDTSALVSLYVPESDAPRFMEVMGLAEIVSLPLSCLVEFALLRRLTGDRRLWLSRLIDGFPIQVISIKRDIAEIAAEAAIQYGRGSGHRARLNFGDCLSYAVAKYLNAPLLFKGDDFIHTDIESALAA
jgi:ribonuclease VapC